MEMNFKKQCCEVVGHDLANPFEYRQLIGALMFLVNTRPDIHFAVADIRLSHHMHNGLLQSMYWYTCMGPSILDWDILLNM